MTEANETYNRAASGECEDLPFKAVGWRIIVKPVPPKTKTPAGIALAEETIEAQRVNEYRGEVVSIGPLAYRDPAKFHPNGEKHQPWCKNGDMVAFNRYGGKPIYAENGTEYRVMDDFDILANITDPAAMRNPY